MKMRHKIMTTAVVIFLFSNLIAQTQVPDYHQKQNSSTKFSIPPNSSGDKFSPKGHLTPQFPVQRFTAEPDFTTLPDLPGNRNLNEEVAYYYDSICFTDTSGYQNYEIPSRDETGRIHSELIKEKEPGSNDWVNLWYGNFVYHPSGKLDSTAYNGWDSALNQWTDSWKYKYTYDSSENLVLYESQYFTTYWNNNRQYIYTNDTSGNRTSIQKRDWDSQNHKWEDDYKIYYTYDNDNNLATYMIRYWYSNNGVWLNNYRIVYGYDQTGILIYSRDYSWDDQNYVWDDFTKSDYIYDPSGNLISEIVKSAYNLDTIATFYYTYDSFNNQLLEVHELIPYYGAGLQEWDKTEYDYDYINHTGSATSYFKDNGTWVPIDRYFDLNLFGRYQIHIYGHYKVDFHYSSYIYDIEESTINNNTFLEVFPNPAESELNIKVHSDSPVSGNISLYDCRGNLVYKVHTGKLYQGDNTLKIDVSDLVPGVYILKFSNEKIYETRKLVITK